MPFGLDTDRTKAGCPDHFRDVLIVVLGWRNQRIGLASIGDDKISVNVFDVNFVGKQLDNIFDF